MNKLLGTLALLVAIALPALAQQPGEALFFGKAACGSCHQVNGRGGVVGPDLSNAGRLSTDALHQKIVEGRRLGESRAFSSTLLLPVPHLVVEAGR